PDVGLIEKPGENVTSIVNVQWVGACATAGHAVPADPVNATTRAAASLHPMCMSEPLRAGVVRWATVRIEDAEGIGATPHIRDGQWSRRRHLTPPAWGISPMGERCP